MALKPQDILLLLKLVAQGGRRDLSYPELALEVGISPSEAHSGLKRAVDAGLAERAKTETIRPIAEALSEFLFHGLRYVFPPQRSGLTRGMPTAHAAPPLVDQMAPSADPPPVWPDPEGTVQGFGFSPLYRSAPRAAKNDPELYALLALVDALRGGNARERKLAVRELTARLNATL